MTITDRLICGDSHCARPAPGILVRLLDQIWLWRERARQRRALLALDDRLLRDIGIGRADAVEEGLRPFWRP